MHAKIIAEQTEILSAADAARADPVLAAAAQVKTYDELRAAAARLALHLDPGSAERCKQARRKEAHVRPFREDSGNAGMTAREMPTDEVLASWQHVDQRARDLRAAGIPGTLRELRVRAYLDLLQERDSRGALRDPEPGRGQGDQSSDGPGEPGGPGHGPGGRPGAGSARPSLAALVNITVPLATLLGRSGTPGEVAGFGLLGAQSARDLIAAAARHPRTRWCVTALHPDGTAAAHGCAPGQHPAPPGPEPPGHAPSASGPPGSGPPGHRTARPARHRQPRHHQPRHHLRHPRRAGPAAPTRHTRHPGPGLPARPARHAHPDRPRPLRPPARRNRVPAQPQAPAPHPRPQHPVHRTRMRTPRGPVRPGPHHRLGPRRRHLRMQFGTFVQTIITQVVRLAPEWKGRDVGARRWRTASAGWVPLRSPGASPLRASRYHERGPGVMCCGIGAG